MIYILVVIAIIITAFILAACRASGSYEFAEPD